MSTMTGPDFGARTTAILDHLDQSRQLKSLQMIEGPMGPSITLREHGEVDCFCSNNYLGLANDPHVGVASDRYRRLAMTRTNAS